MSESLSTLKPSVGFFEEEWQYSYLRKAQHTLLSARITLPLRLADEMLRQDLNRLRLIPYNGTFNQSCVISPRGSARDGSESDVARRRQTWHFRKLRRSDSPLFWTSIGSDLDVLRSRCMFVDPWDWRNCLAALLLTLPGEEAVDLVQDKAAFRARSRCLLSSQQPQHSELRRCAVPSGSWTHATSTAVHRPTVHDHAVTSPEC